MTSCARGCTTHGQHDPATNCTCTTECPDHDGHCSGCLPRPTNVGHYCQPCANKLRDALNAIPDLAVNIANLPGGKLISKATPGDPGRRATKVDQQSPSPAWDTTEEVIQWAHAWATVIADETHQAGPFRYNTAGIPMRNLSGSISFMLNRLTQILAADYHADIYNETLSFRKRLMHASGTDRATTRLNTRCPDCNQRTLTREDGSDDVTCANRDCGRIWRDGEHGWLAHLATA